MTVTDFDTAVDQALLIASDLDWEPACQSPNCEAGNPSATHLAIWRFNCACYYDYACSHCVERLIRAYELKRQPWQRGWRCKYCGAVYVGQDVVTFRPLP